MADLDMDFSSPGLVKSTAISFVHHNPFAENIELASKDFGSFGSLAVANCIGFEASNILG